MMGELESMAKERFSQTLKTKALRTWTLFLEHLQCKERQLNLASEFDVLRHLKSTFVLWKSWSHKAASLRRLARHFVNAGYQRLKLRSFHEWNSVSSILSNINKRCRQLTQVVHMKSKIRNFFVSGNSK